MAIDELKQILVQCIQNNRDEIIEIGETIYRTPETGFREFQTAAYVRSKLDEWGVTYTNIEEYPGIKVTIDTGREGPGLAIVGELDALICPEHPDSDREAGAVHACGHNAQIVRPCRLARSARADQHDGFAVSIGTCGARVGEVVGPSVIQREHEIALTVVSPRWHF